MSTPPPPPPTPPPPGPPPGRPPVPPPVPAIEDEEWPAVMLHEVVKRYGRTTAVAGITLDVPHGAMVGLIGPNGAGKTTTMRAIAGLLIPDAGHVRVMGEDPLRRPRRVRRLVGWMPDFFGVYGGLTSQEYLDFFAACYKVPAKDRPDRVAELLDLVRLTDKATTDVAGLSRGMQQRLGLARALVHDPKVLLLDEPASGLDPRARIELREILLALQQQGTTILISSHILAELAEMCDRVVILDQGGVVASGGTEELQDQLSQGTTGVRVRLVDPAATEQAAALAAQAATVEHVERGVLYVRVTGGDTEVGAVLRRLVTEGVDVAELAQQRQGLEELFMSLTAAPPPGTQPPGAPQEGMAS